MISRAVPRCKRRQAGGEQPHPVGSPVATSGGTILTTMSQPISQRCAHDPVSGFKLLKQGDLRKMHPRRFISSAAPSAARSPLRSRNCAKLFGLRHSTLKGSPGSGNGKSCCSENPRPPVRRFRGLDPRGAHPEPYRSPISSYPDSGARHDLRPGLSRLRSVLSPELRRPAPVPGVLRTRSRSTAVYRPAPGSYDPAPPTPASGPSA
jgi:hypothetical protein